MSAVNYYIHKNSDDEVVVKINKKTKKGKYHIVGDNKYADFLNTCLLYTSPSPRD